MDINDIIELNNRFYKSNAEEFSKTRKNYWHGWQNILPYINKENSKLLDVGCGNGRLFSFLSENLKIKFNYTGIDINEYLIDKAKATAPSTDFRILNIFKHLNDLNEKYDYIFIFGVMHHVPNASFRKEWLLNLANKLNDKGLIFLTTWQINNDLRSKNLIKIENGEENDFLYGWANTETQRYVHIYSDKEVKELVKTTEKLKIIDQYVADGKSNKLNKYYILKSI